MPSNVEKLFEQIAKEHLLIDTLAVRNRDCYDFHEVSVIGVKRALEAAYNAGLQNGRAGTVKIRTRK